MDYKGIQVAVFMFLLFVFNTVVSAQEVNNKLFFKKNIVGIGLVFIEANTDPDKGVGDPTAFPLRHDYTSLLKKSGWKIASPKYQDVAISCLIEEDDSSSLVIVHCYNNNPNSNILMLLTILTDAEIEPYISETIELMIDKMIEDKPSPQEPSRVPDFFWKYKIA